MARDDGCAASAGARGRPTIADAQRWLDRQPDGEDPLTVNGYAAATLVVWRLDWYD